MMRPHAKTLHHPIKRAALTGWKIAGTTYTVESTGCPESPLGPPR